jgi:radical SAM superfamily enzyme YgiQ (UPF0313 family)
VNNPPRQLYDDLDSLPFPGKHLFNIEHYVKSAGEIIRFGNIITSRGCPFFCTYCSNKIYGKSVRFRSPENVILEIKNLKEAYGINKFVFLDDCITLKRERMMEICRLMMSGNLNIKWVCITRVDAVDQELLMEMKKAGCIAIDYGIESGIPETLVRVKKGFIIKDVENALKWTDEVGINSMVNFMHGFPWETAEEISRSRDFIKKIKPLVSGIMPSGIVIPFPKTNLYEEYWKKYEFEGWWLKRKLIERGGETNKPLFEKIFFNYYPLQENFFKYSPEIVREIKKTALLIGRHNLLRYAKRISSNSFFCLVIREILFSLVLLSRILFKLSPQLENRVMSTWSSLASRYQLQD